MLNKLHAKGINKSDPPATPEAPHADKLPTIANSTAAPKLTSIPKVCAAAQVKILMVIAAPAILIAEPKGILTE